MNNKKLFAIITLVAFMMTLLPVAAFAANRHTSNVYLDADDSVLDADGQDDGEFTVYVRNADNSAAGNTPVYVASERGAVDTIALDGAGVEKGFVDGANHDKGVWFLTDDKGKLEFKVTSTADGEAEIAVGLVNTTVGTEEHNPYAYLTDADVTAQEAEIIGTKVISFEATGSSDVKVVDMETKEYSNVTYTEDDKATDTVDNNNDGTVDEENEAAGNRYYKDVVVKDNSNNTQQVKANGIDYYEVTFKVENAANAPVPGEEVEFSTSDNELSFNKNDAETNNAGEVTVKVYAEEGGVYDLTAKVGSNKAKVTLNFAATDPVTIELASDIDEKIAIDEDKVDSFKIKVLDGNNNVIDPNDSDSTTSYVAQNIIDQLDFEWVSEPADSSLADDWATANTAASNKYLEATTDKFVKVFVPEIEEEGNYQLRISLDNGKNVVVDFEALEQGEIVELEFSYDTPAIPLDGKSAKPTLKHKDANGVVVSQDTTDSDFEYSISDFRALYEKGNVTYNGSTVDPKDLNNTNGVIFTTTDDDYLGEYVVTVVDTQEDITASTTIKVIREVTSLDVEVPETLVINEDQELKLSLLDGDGLAAAFGDAGATIDFNYYVTSKPEGARVDVDILDGYASDLKEDGFTYFNVQSDTEGQVNLTLLLKVKSGTSDLRTYTKNVTLNFGTPKEEVGAKNVTMFIGSTGYVIDGVAKNTDVAPFIQDNRTFVPVRMISEALGADVEWDEATQTVTIAREDKTITLTIGSNILNVSNGETIVSDVAPFITNGRTVLPFRVIGEAFGADVEAVFAADGTVSAVTFVQ